MNIANPKIAAVGVGYWGRNIARVFAELDALAAVCDFDANVAQKVATDNGVEVGTLDDVLADDAIDGIAIATSAPTHFEIAMAAIEAGKHVFVEKPLVLEPHHADALIEAAEARSKVLMVGHLLRYHPLFRKMLEIVQAGTLGKLRYIQSDRQSLGKIRTEEDVIWSFSPHDLSMILALTGGEPVDIRASGAAFISSGVADIATLQMDFEGSVHADIRVSWLHPVKLQQIVAICEKGAIVFRDSEPEWARKLAVYPFEVLEDAGAFTPHRGEAQLVEVPQDEPLKLECSHFLDCIAHGKSALTDGNEGRAVLRALRQATRAMEVAG